MRYNDTNGNEWDTAEEALDEFLANLPDLTEEETEEAFQFTSRDNNAEANLKAIAYGITYAGLDAKFSGDNYPVPEPFNPPMTWQTAYDRLTELGVSEDTIAIVTSINGTSLDTMESILYAKFGYRSFEQMDEATR